jgi:hypothetical protein
VTPSTVSSTVPVTFLTVSPALDVPDVASSAGLDADLDAVGAGAAVGEEPEESPPEPWPGVRMSFRVSPRPPSSPP